MKNFKFWKTSKINLENEFEKRKPWITKFRIEGKEYGGDYDAMNDKRVDQFFSCFPNVNTILELSSLEGGHTIRLRKYPTVKKVITIEGRQDNIDKARFIQSLFGVNNIEFIKANLENYDISLLGNFDAVFCVGLLYHLPEPWKIIEKISKVSSNIFIWTHYSDESDANITINGFSGIMFQEGDLINPLSGLSAKSFWPTLKSLEDMLGKYGFKNINFIENNLNHPNGRCVTLAAKSM